MEKKTIGISPKAVLAFLLPLVAAVATSAVSWISSGEFNDNEIRAAVGGLILAGVALLGAYVGKPGNVVNATPGQE